MGIQDVPAEYLIEETAGKLISEIQKPEWTDYVKTGMHVERAPQRQDWFYVRMASILYRAFKWGTIGTEALRSYYGGRRNRGVKKEHHYKASGKVIRTCVQALEKAGYLERAQPSGRKITTKGFRLLNDTAKIAEKNWKEGKYVHKEKAKKAFDEKKKKEVHDTLRRDEHGGHKISAEAKDKKQSQKSAKKKEGEQ